MSKSSVRVIAVGDVHGDLNQLMYPLREFLTNKGKYDYIIFLGDYIDRGESALYIYEILSVISSCKEFKDKIIFLRGNHDSSTCTTNDELVRGKWNFQGFGTMKEFTFDLFYNASFLKMYHYDKRLNVLFTHGSTSKPLEFVKTNFNTTDKVKRYELLWTYDNETKDMSYRNIHAHTHTFDDKETCDKFFSHWDCISNCEKKMLSIDDDSSYGNGLEENAHFEGIDDNKIKPLVSNVKFISFDSNGNYEIFEDKIDFFDEQRNYNLYMFCELKKVLMSWHKAFNKLSFDRCVKTFEKLFIERVNKYKTIVTGSKLNGELVSKGIKSIYNENMNVHIGFNTCFHNVPVDILQHYGLFKNETKNYIGKYYFTMIDRLDRYYKIYDSVNSNSGSSSVGIYHHENENSNNDSLPLLDEDENTVKNNYELLGGGNNNNNKRGDSSCWLLLMSFVLVVGLVVILVAINHKFSFGKPATTTNIIAMNHNNIGASNDKLY